MAEEVLDENDPLYAFKKWGPDYRTKDVYWQWRHARDDKERDLAGQKRAKDRKPKGESSPYFFKPGW